MRTFVYTGDTFSADAWFDGLKKGHTFVSNGPALFLEADESLPGMELARSKGATANLTVKAMSHASIGAIERLAVYNNDGLVMEEINHRKTDSVDMFIAHTLHKSQWISAVAYCDNGAVAHTTPVYYVVDGQPTWDAKKAPDIIEKQLAAIRSIEEETNAKMMVDEGILSRLEEAKAFYGELLNGISGR